MWTISGMSDNWFYLGRVSQRKHVHSNLFSTDWHLQMAKQVSREMGQPMECHSNNVHLYYVNYHRVPCVLENIKENWQTFIATSMEKALVLPNDIHGIPSK